MNSDQKFRCDLIIDVDGGDKVFHSNIDGVYSTAISSTSTSVLQYFFDPSGPSCYKREVVSGTSTDITYNTINEWTILYSDDTISGGNTYPAYKVSFDNTDTDLESVNVQDVILELEENFQDGVDAVYDAVVAKGSTPTSHSLSDVVTGIGNIETGITPSGTLNISTNGTHDVTNYASASVAVPTHGTVTKKFYSAVSKPNVGYGEVYFTVSVNSSGTISITATAGKMLNGSTMVSANSFGVYTI